MPNLDRRSFLAAFGSALAAAGLAGCSGDDSTTGTNGTGSDAAAGVSIDKAAYDQLIQSGPVASDETIAASEWASKIKKNGKLRVGCTRTSTLFSLLDDTDNKVYGFDAGLYQLLARYITGSQDNVELVQVTSDTRESVLQNDQVDVVFATYTITDARQEVISFAGPYYTSQYSILVTEGNTEVTSLADLAGKNVAAQSGSTGPQLLEEYAPEADVQEFSTDEEARAALEQGRVDAYVFDDSMNRGSIVKNPGKYKVVGEVFGPIDPYGIGLPKGSDGVDFCDDFLVVIEDNGDWGKLWQITIGDRTGSTDVPAPPEITTRTNG